MNKKISLWIKKIKIKFYIIYLFFSFLTISYLNYNINHHYPTYSSLDIVFHILSLPVMFIFSVFSLFFPGLFNNISFDFQYLLIMFCTTILYYFLDKICKKDMHIKIKNLLMFFAILVMFISIFKDYKYKIYDEKIHNEWLNQNSPIENHFNDKFMDFDFAKYILENNIYSSSLTIDERNLRIYYWAILGAEAQAPANAILFINQYCDFYLFNLKKSSFCITYHKYLIKINIHNLENYKNFSLHDLALLGDQISSQKILINMKESDEQYPFWLMIASENGVLTAQKKIGQLLINGTITNNQLKLLNIKQKDRVSQGNFWVDTANQIK